MGKFQVFKYNQFVMSLIGISSDRSNDLYQFMKNVYFFCCLFGICVISVGVFLFNHRTDFRLVVPASLPLLAGLQASGCYLNIRLKTKEIQMLNLSLQRIVNEGLLILFYTYYLAFPKDFRVFQIDEMLFN